ncbi:MAG: TIGR04282 family arsenosugar biosynthesis glycosyltransferase [Gammaproteobacteria bacterium]
MNYLYPDTSLIIFCKAPIPGQVKTRLQPALTPEQAAEAHRKLTLMTLERAFNKMLCPVTLCCSPDNTHPFFQQCAQNYPLSLSTQHGDDLGQRMHNAFVEAFSEYRHAVLTGCDCPSLTVQDLEQAIKRLESSDAVIAPAEDGGYVLIGLNAPQAALFGDMRWSHCDVMANTLERARQASLTVFELGLQQDIDTVADWKRYLRAKS